MPAGRLCLPSWDIEADPGNEEMPWKSKRSPIPGPLDIEADPGNEEIGDFILILARMGRGGGPRASQFCSPSPPPLSYAVGEGGEGRELRRIHFTGYWL